MSFIKKYYSCGKVMGKRGWIKMYMQDMPTKAAKRWVNKLILNGTIELIK